MRRVLITGMSGTGKSSVVAELTARGVHAVDLDEGGYSELVSVPEDEPTGLDPGLDWVWREDRVQALLDAEVADLLVISGCSPNQGAFYPHLDRVILLTAPAEVIVARLAARTTNPYGKRPEEVARVLESLRMIEPLLRRRATDILDTTAPLNDIVERVLRIGAG